MTTKAPRTIEEVRNRQGALVASLGALAPEPLVKDEPLPQSLGETVRERKAKRLAAFAKNQNWNR